MKIFKIRLDRDEILKIPECERQVFLTIAHIQNEISILLRSVLWSSDLSSSNEAVVQGQVSINLFFIKLLVGKLFEGWDFLKKSFFTCKALADDFSKFASPEQLASFDTLKKYFSKENLVYKVRNGYAFHYSHRELDNALKGIPDELDLYVEEKGNCNTLYYFAEILANSAVLNLINPSDNADALKHLEEEALNIARCFVKFGQAYMSFVIKRHSPQIWKEAAKPVEFEKLLVFSEMHLPWFTDSRNESEKNQN